MKDIRLAAGIALLALCGVSLRAEIPSGYYSGLDGKQGVVLRNAVAALADGHQRITYNTKTWGAFEFTDVREIEGRRAWWDMYSNNIVYLPEHAAINIEHAVANSWWGGKNGSQDAYADLFHLNPSDQNANNKKSNCPPGEVTDTRILDNGLLKIGTPRTGQGGGSDRVFEPADEYKGDFARAYFYIFTTYGTLSWKSDYAYVYNADGSLQDWARDLLLSWHRQDPVDSKEQARNEEIYKLQNNRNPYIDYPQLAEYVWGDRSGESFNLSAEEPAEAVDRPSAPVFGDAWLTAVDTYSRRWWDGIEQTIDYDRESGELRLSIDGREYFTPTASTLEIDPAFTSAETHTYSAYVVSERGGLTLRSPIARLTVTARDPGATDYSRAVWERVTDQAEADPTGVPYLILSSNTLHAMSVRGGVTGTTFMESAGFVKFDQEDKIVELPVDAAVVNFSSAGDGQYCMKVQGVDGSDKGYWYSTAEKKMELSSDLYTPGSWSISDNGAFVFTLGNLGQVQFNASQPRFLNYTTKQTPVYLYKFVGYPENTGVTVPSEDDWAVGITGNTLTVPEYASVYDLNGRRVSPIGLQPGVYIVSGRGKSVKIRL